MRTATRCPACARAQARAAPRPPRAPQPPRVTIPPASWSRPGSCAWPGPSRSARRTPPPVPSPVFAESHSPWPAPWRSSPPAARPCCCSCPNPATRGRRGEDARRRCPPASRNASRECPWTRSLIRHFRRSPSRSACHPDEISVWTEAEPGASPSPEFCSAAREYRHRRRSRWDTTWRWDGRGKGKVSGWNGKGHLFSPYLRSSPYVPARLAKPGGFDNDIASAGAR